VRAAYPLAALAALAGCARVATRPAATEGASVYTVGALSFEAPTAWQATGDERHVKIVAPGDDATIEASAHADAGSEAECLSGAEAALDRGAAGLSAVQRHPSTLAGRKAVEQEADRGGWHGWAWATCDGGVQYRLWFAGRSPLSREMLDAQKRLVGSAQIGGSR